MSNMSSVFRYSQIVGTAFYGIRLSKDDYALVDAHFVAAAHHRFRAMEATGDLAMRFHSKWYFKHIIGLLSVVARGDFKNAKDPSVSERLTGMACAEAWAPHTRFPRQVLERLPARPSMLDYLLPHAEMFDDMDCDERFGEGFHHPFDFIFIDKLPVASLHTMLVSPLTRSGIA